MMIIDWLKEAAGAVFDATGLPWPVIASTLVALCVLPILIRLVRRLVRGAAASTGTQRWSALAQMRRAAVLAGGGLGLVAAAYGTIRALTAWGQPLPLAIATSAAIEGGAITMAADLYLRARAGLSATRPRVASWLYAAASAYANTVHPPASTSTAGAAIFGLVPLLGLYLIEYQAHAEADHNDDRQAAWPLRVAGAAWRRWWTGIATWLGVDLGASDTDTERELAARRAARSTYDLRLAKAHLDAHPDSRRAARRVRRCTARSQAARERAGVATDPRQAQRMAVMMRELVHGPTHATGDWNNIAAATALLYGGPVLLDPAGGGVYDLTGRTPAALSAPVSGALSASLSAPLSGQVSGQQAGPADRRTARPDRARTDKRTSRRTASRTDRVPRPRPDNGQDDGHRTGPADMAELVTLARTLMADMDGAVNRPRLVRAIRASGQTLSADRAAELWRQVKPTGQENGQHAGQAARTGRTSDPDSIPDKGADSAGAGVLAGADAA